MILGHVQQGQQFLVHYIKQSVSPKNLQMVSKNLELLSLSYWNYLSLS